MAKIPVFTTTHVSELICRCRTAVFSFIQSIGTAWCHDTNSYSSVHFCNFIGLLLPSVMWTKRVFLKGIAVNYLFIPIYTIYTNTQQQQKEKKHYHDINIVIREMIFFFFFLNLPRPSHFPGMNKVYCYWILLFWFYF